VGRRQGLDQVICMTPEGIMNEQAGSFAGLDRYACRKAVVEALDTAGLLEKTEKHVHQVGHHDRCGHIIEPYLSRQWFLKMDKLAAPAVRAVVEGDIKLFPERWVGVYDNWMSNIRDWCITLLGTSDPRLVLRCLRRGDRRAHRTGTMPRLRWRPAIPGGGCPRYLVQQLAVDLFSAGLARQDHGPGKIPSDLGSGHRTGYHLFLGCPDDHGQLRVQR